MPAWLETFGHVVYRITFFLILPVRVVAAMFFPRLDHHWPMAHYMVACLGTPYFWWGMYHLAHRIYRAWFVRRPKEAVHVPGDGMPRRQFLARSMAGSIGIATSGMGGYASLIAPERLKVREYDIPIQDLPASMDGLRIVHVSDTHYGPFVTQDFLERAFTQANGLDGDLVLLTGDYVHFTPEAVEPGIKSLTQLRSRLGKVAVMGNHEHWEGADACRAVFDQTDIPLIDNTRLFLTPDGLTDSPKGKDCICIAGVGDLWEDDVCLDKVLDGLPSNMPRLLLSHNPDVAELIVPQQRVDLMLSGHTHGGQVRLPIMGAPVTPSNFGNKYVGGLCAGPHCPVVVSRGIGVAGIPIRFCVPPELGLITLRRA